ncbi:MAG: 2-amino-4-hydroxy-6-hydroxymethyldihydropteridine diphosphokinase, partial [Limnobacter sp.]|nr:2-amino-4-hydroxy-6-hydroxymethyldihydropteridine diphosphokinase [Limnobacter sp.]
MTEREPLITAYLGMGGNLGNPQTLFSQALELLGQNPSCKTVRESQRLESKPIDADGPNYLNSVVEITWAGSAQDLLALCMSIEQQLGRVRSTHNAPRLIDLDVLLFGQETICEPDLQVPHPR